MRSQAPLARSRARLSYAPAAGSRGGSTAAERRRRVSRVRAGAAARRRLLLVEPAPAAARACHGSSERTQQHAGACRRGARGRRRTRDDLDAGGEVVRLEKLVYQVVRAVLGAAPDLRRRRGGGWQAALWSGGNAAEVLGWSWERRQTCGEAAGGGAA